LATGENLTKGNPIYALRSLLEKDRMAIRRFGQTYRLAVIIKAWNAYRDGREVKSLRWTQGGANPEPFPEAI
jgi:hypothetical protein